MVRSNPPTEIDRVPELLAPGNCTRRKWGEPVLLPTGIEVRLTAPGHESERSFVLIGPFIDLADTRRQQFPCLDAFRPALVSAVPKFAVQIFAAVVAAGGTTFETSNGPAL